MCGFGLIFSKFKSLSNLNFDNKSLEWRGVDECFQGKVNNDRIFYVHYRLAITSIKDKLASQPFVTDDLHTMVNGEIYNWQKIKSNNNIKNINGDCQLIHNFLSRNLISEIDELNGFFSFIHFDSKKVYFGRSGNGKKPLFYFNNNDSLVVSSSAEWIYKNLYLLGIKLNNNIDAIKKNFEIRFISSDESHYEKIMSVNPGDLCQYYDSGDHLKISKLTFNKYYKTIKNKNIVKDKDSNHLQKLENLILTSVENRISKEVNNSITLSSGIDSQLIFYAAKKLSYDNISLGHVIMPSSYDESSITRNIAKNSNYPFEIFKFNRDDNVKYFLDSVKYCGYFMPNFAQQYFLYKSLKKTFNTKVVINGVGGDELFYGYDIHRIYFFLQTLNKLKLNIILNQLKLFPFLNFFNYKINKIFTILSSSPLKAYKLLRNHSLENENINIFNNNKKLNFINNINEFDLQEFKHFDFYEKFVNHQLLCDDRSSLAAGVEVRSPFLDISLSNFASTLDVNRNLSLFKGKKLLRKLLQKWTSSSRISNLSKKGFESNLSITFIDVYDFFLEKRLIKEINWEKFGINNNNILKYFDTLEKRKYKLTKLDAWRGLFLLSIGYNSQIL